MRRLLSLLATAALLACASSAFAQSDMIIKQKAKQLPGAQSPNPAPPPRSTAPAASTPTPAPAPAAPTLTPDQLQSIDAFTAQLSAIKAGATLGADQKASFEKDAAALAKGGAKPSKESVSKLSGDLSTALSGKDVTLKDQALLSKAVYAVFNSGTLTAAQAQNAVNVAQKSLKSANVAEADVKTVATDLGAIVAELQKSKPKLYQ
jgi:hypothetical protein